MLSREQFLKRTAFRFRAKTAASRGLNEREEALAAFVYDEACEEIVRSIMEGMREAWYGVPPCEEAESG
jgi:hypothetical protein